jgi:hypothetical protein
MKAKARTTTVDRPEVRANERAAGSNESGSMLDRAFLVLSSERTTAILVILLCLLVGLTAIIPQGHEALELAEDPGATAILELARWGFTEIFESQWIRALGVLLAANLIAHALQVLGRPAEDISTSPPSSAGFRTELTASLPERAVEILRNEFRIWLGPPRKERVEGSRVSMVFDSGAERRSPMAVHLGLVLLVVGAGLLADPVKAENAVVRAELDVKDRSTGFVGNFDMVSNETFTFFRYPGRYAIRGYVPAKGALGPAIRMERSDPDQRGSEHFWIYLNAPEGFDERHRRSDVAIRARKMSLVPVPGKGIASSSESVVLLLGMGLVIAGLAGVRRPSGRVWVDADGERVTITGMAGGGDDAGFKRRFDRWALAARGALEE